MADVPVNPVILAVAVNAAGEVIGINGMIGSRTGFRINSGLAFAISHQQIAAWLPVYRRRVAVIAGMSKNQTEWQLTQIATGQFRVEAGPLPLQPGDVIIAINDVAPFSPEHVTALI